MSLNSISDYLDDITSSRRRPKNQEYVKLPTHDNGFVDAQFQIPAQQIPWKSIMLASLLLIYPDRMWPMIILGILMFIPGAYHVRIAYYAYKEVPGFSFDDIPEFD
ncbi:transmembrane protein 230-like isoform X2 [Cylas formicarius]|uniref:transmembrane protein 230-like isoform X2 n=1 Tax=Cylas formicarius TaxID=197179 RepID=UPI002958849E|nr:transmembrane protein 230-like isoform X2 [Cylas formicarius]